MGQCGDGGCGCHFHLLVNCGGAAVEGGAEYVGEAQHIVDLVGIVGAPGGEYDVGARGHGFLVGDFRVGVGQGEHNRARSHRADHFGGEHIGHGEAQEDVGPLHCIGKGDDVGALGHEFLFVWVEVFSRRRYHPFGVAHYYIAPAHSQGAVKVGAGHCRCSGSVDHHFHLLYVFALELEGIEKPGSRYYGRAVLVVVHDGDVAFTPERAFDFKAFRGLYILQVYPAESGGERFHNVDEASRFLLVNLDVEGIESGENLEK